MTKTTNINIRADQQFKKKVTRLAKLERRSVANMIEIAVEEYIKNKKIKVSSKA